VHCKHCGHELHMARTTTSLPSRGTSGSASPSQQRMCASTSRPSTR
jgi:hypothetical protein